jgi:thermitase
MTRGLRLAIDYARTQGRQGKGCPVFWAVANETVPIAWDRVCSYAGTIAVGRSNRLDLENGSAYGPELDFLAPGVEVYSTRSRNRYNEATGTSFAAPLAAGVAALVLSCSPELSAEQVRERLRTTCDKIGGPSVHYVDGRHDKYGSGRVNAFQAVR